MKWNHTSFTTNSKCQTSIRYRAWFKVVEVCNRNKVWKRIKIKLEVGPKVPKTKVNIKHANEPRSSEKLELRLQKKNNKIGKRGKVKFEIRPKNTTKGKWSGD